MNTIDQAFEVMAGWNHKSDALIDCMNVYTLGKDRLEQLLDYQLWINSIDNTLFLDEIAQQYYIELGGIEEFLCMNDLIYNDGSSFV